MTDADGEMWLQTIYYPFYYFANYGRGTVLQSIYYGEFYDCEGFSNVPYLDQVVVWNRARNEIAVFLVNRREHDSQEVEIVLQGMRPSTVKEAVYLSAEDKKMTNQKDHLAVRPRKSDAAQLKENCVTTTIMPLSFMMIRVGI